MKAGMDMVDQPPATEYAQNGRSTQPRLSAHVDLTLLLAVHHGLRRDLQRFLKHVDTTSVAERDRWHALCARWDLFAVLVRHCFQWEKLHLWPLLAAAAEPESQQFVDATLATSRARAEAVEAMIESSRPIFARLAHARDEDAIATLRARVRAACGALEESLDLEEDDVVPLIRRHVGSHSWTEGQHHLFEVDPLEAGGHGAPWLVHELPLETAAVLAAGWSEHSPDELSARTAAFRDLEARAFGRAWTGLAGA